jgi:hypothetical protein
MRLGKTKGVTFSRNPLILLVAKGGIEPPTRGFSNLLYPSFHSTSIYITTLKNQTKSTCYDINFNLHVDFSTSKYVVKLNRPATNLPRFLSQPKKETKLGKANITNVLATTCPPEMDSILFHDSIDPCLNLIVNKKGSKSFHLVGSFNGEQVRKKNWRSYCSSSPRS